MKRAGGEKAPTSKRESQRQRFTALALLCLWEISPEGKGHKDDYCFKNKSLSGKEGREKNLIIYTYMYIHIYTYVYTYIPIYIHICTHTYICVLYKTVYVWGKGMGKSTGVKGKLWIPSYPRILKGSTWPVEVSRSPKGRAIRKNSYLLNLFCFFFSFSWPTTHYAAEWAGDYFWTKGG